MTMLAQRRNKSGAHWDVTQSPSFRGCHFALPVRPLHAQLAFAEINVAPLETDHLPETKPSVTPEESDWRRSLNHHYGDIIDAVRPSSEALISSGCCLTK
jgi:hypothetical protein